MLAADPQQPRQLSDRNPILLWRDRAGRREGLALLPAACAEPGCTCREMLVEGLAVGDDLIGIASDGLRAKLVWAPSSPGGGARVLHAEVDIDAGTAKPHPDASPWERDADALAWLRAELERGLLLDHLRRRFRLDKHLPVEPPPEDGFAWDQWEPGEMVRWDEVFPESSAQEPPVVAGRDLTLREWYCANPKCDCGELQIFVHENVAHGPTRFRGHLRVSSRHGTLLELQSEDDDASALLAEVWATLKVKHDVARHYVRRCFVIRAAATEGRRLASQRASLAERESRRPAGPPATPRNAPCPCGSGLKFKKCCLGKDPSMP